MKTINKIDEKSIEIVETVETTNRTVLNIDVINSEIKDLENSIASNENQIEFLKGEILKQEDLRNLLLENGVVETVEENNDIIEETNN